MTGVAGDGDPGSRGRGPLSLIAEAEFRKLWSVGVLQGAMRWLELLAIGVWTYALTESPVLVALMTLLRQLPMALFGSVIGAVAERLDRKAILVVAQATMATTSGLLAVLVASGGVELWHVAVGAFVNGLCWSTDLPVRRTILGESVGVDRLGPAMSMDSASNNATRMVGPLAGGALYAAVGLGGAFAVASAFYGVSALVAISIRFTPVPKDPRRFTLIADIREGLAYLRRTRALLGHLGVTVIVNLFGFPYAAMAPVVGRETFQVDAVRIGLLLTVEGVGAFAGAVAIAFLARPARFRSIYLTGSALFMAGVLGFSLTTNYWVALVVLTVGGVGIAGFASMQSAIMFGEAPPAIRSRLMGVLSVCIGAGPLGVLHVGWLADRIGGSQALTVIAAEGLVALAVLVLAVPELRGRVKVSALAGSDRSGRDAGSS
ncbi:MAG: MFS transporter [Thalassobaculum sp.]|uniref:MFS transporter n=1 Tax=Thalassobaculum sp. TaxID=2022740 RepID=UPI0032ECD29C